MSFNYLEPYIDERIEKTREKVYNIIELKEYQNTDDFIMALRMIVSKQYNIPIFSKFYEDLTLDQLLFEVEVIKILTTPQEQKTSNMINENKEEMSGMFDDFAKEDEWKPVDDPFSKISEEFMKTGQFTNE